MKTITRKVNETYTINDIYYDIILYIQFNVIDEYYDEKGFTIEKIEYRDNDIYKNFNDIKNIITDIFNGLWKNEINDILYQKVTYDEILNKEISEEHLHSCIQECILQPAHTFDIIDGIVYVIYCNIKTTKINNIIQTENYEIIDIEVYEQSEIGLAFQCYPETKKLHIKQFIIDKILAGDYNYELIYKTLEK